MFASAVTEERGPGPTLVDVETLNLLGAPTATGLVGVDSVQGGFAELDLPTGPCLLALDFLPRCRAGDVLAFRRRGNRVTIAIDRKATARAEKKLLRLWSMLSA